MLKSALYDEMEQLVRQMGLTTDMTETKAKLMSLIQTLKEGRKVQESSANLMSFIVQDLLDYAQIKAGKFRKQIKPFNIREAVERVMSI